MKDKYAKEELKEEKKEREETNEEEGVDLEQLQGVLKSELDDAQDFIDAIGEDRAEATRYYMGDEPEGGSDLQSEYISTDVRDSVLYMLPSILRTFFGTKRVVEFVPNGPEDIPLAEQQTDYINHVIQEKNHGFQVLYDAFKDALVRKTGFVKAYWDDSVTSSTYDYTGLNREQYMALVSDADVEVVEESVKYETQLILDQLTGEQIEQEFPVEYDVVIRRVKKANKVTIEAIPPEEVLIARDARDIKSSSYVAHRMMKTVSDLVAMGYDYDFINENSSGGNDNFDTDDWDNEQARQPYDDSYAAGRSDPGSASCLYVEHYLFYDLDDDGIAERIRVCTVGGGLTIANVMQWDDLPIVLFCPDPEPHTAIGTSIADYVMPLQRAKSQIMRDTLDSLGHSIFPRYGVVEGQVNIDDVLNSDIGQPIRMRAPGMVQPFTVPFVGAAAFPVLDYLDEAKEQRTGVSKASMGMNAEALQSTTKAAVAATMSAAQGRVEMISRIFAEEGMTDLFRLVNRLIIKHQDQQEMVRLNNSFIPIDPRVWDSEKDIVVNVAITNSSDEERIQTLMMVAQKQEQIMTQLGPQNPMVTPQMYANTLQRMIEMAGFKDSNQFINSNFPPIPPQPPQQDPATLLAEAELQKSQVSAQKAIIDAETDRLKLIMEDDLKRDEIEADMMLKSAELQAKYGAQINVAEIKSLMERDREVLRQAAKIQAQGLIKPNSVQ
jgi:hypothetical protein|tara:strand:+ start:2721 stop:4880 length:2160 start_codon:yes stop_codon:yes gene_type:complete